MSLFYIENFTLKEFFMKEYLQTKETVMSEQSVTPSGLMSDEAAKRLEKYGKNKLAEGKRIALSNAFCCNLPTL